jgi:hypothetical protein
VAAEIFASVAHLLNLDLDIVFVDTTSTHWFCRELHQTGDGVRPALALAA